MGDGRTRSGAAAGETRKDDDEARAIRKRGRKGPTRRDLLAHLLLIRDGLA